MHLCYKYYWHKGSTAASVPAYVSGLMVTAQQQPFEVKVPRSQAGKGTMRMVAANRCHVALMYGIFFIAATVVSLARVVVM